MMNEIIISMVELAVMAAVLLVTRYVVPYIREKIGSERLGVAEKWARYAVLTAQQTLTASTGSEKKAYVTEFLGSLLVSKNIQLTDGELDVLIESAVKAMKMNEN